MIDGVTRVVEGETLREILKISKEIPTNNTRRTIKPAITLRIRSSEAVLSLVLASGS